MIRAATSEEQAIVRDSLEAVERGLYEGFLSGKVLAIVAPEGPEGPDDDVAGAGAAPGEASGPGQPRGPLDVVLVDAMVLDLPAALLGGATGGLRVGVLDGGFALDLQGAILLARETRRQAVRVNEKASRLFLYGRNILGQSVLSYDPSLRPGDHCIVTNPRHEALGIGRVVGSFKGTGAAVEAVHDLGSYLRDE